MEWVENLKGNRVALDTAPLLYFIEEHPGYLATVKPFFESLDRGDITVVTSTVTLLEVLVHPLRHKDSDLAQQYRDILLNAEGLTTLALTPDIAEEAARLRAAHSLRTPDAIQLATALCAGAAYLLTNDARLPSLPGLELLQVNSLKARPTERG